MRAASLALGVLLGWGGWAQTSREAARRADTQAQLDRIMAGEGVEGAINRLHYGSDAAYATRRLSELLAASTDLRQRRDLARALSGLAHAAAREPLEELLGDPDAPLRMTAVQGLSRIGEVNVALLRPLLADATLGVRREVARALGKRRDPTLGKELLAAARAEGEPEVRAALLVAVGQSGDKKLAKPVEAFLTHTSESTRFAAARGLCLMGSEAGLSFARQLLASQDGYERRQGVELFEGSSAKVASKLLRPLLGKADRRVAAMAARILYQGGEQEMLAWLVLQSHRANAEHKLIFETELEELRLPDDQRKAILAKAGIR